MRKPRGGRQSSSRGRAWMEEWGRDTNHDSLQEVLEEHDGVTVPLQEPGQEAGQALCSGILNLQPLLLHQ